MVEVSSRHEAEYAETKAMPVRIVVTQERSIFRLIGEEVLKLEFVWVKETGIIVGMEGDK